MRRIALLFVALISSAWLWAQTPTGKTFSTIATMTSVDGSTYFVTLDGTPKVWKKFTGATLRAYVNSTVTSISNATGLTGISNPYEGDLAINTAKDTLWIRDDAAWIVFKAGTSGSTPTLQNVLVAGNSANSTRITNLGTPIGTADAATKGYVDTQLSSAVDAANVYASNVAQLQGDSALARSTRRLRDSLARTAWVTQTDLANNSVGSNQIITGAVGADEIAASGVAAGTYGNSSTIPVISVDQDGRVTGMSTASVSGGQAQIQFQSEGSNLGAAGTVTNVNVTGTGVIASRSGNTVTINAENPTPAEIVSSVNSFLGSSSWQGGTNNSNAALKDTNWITFASYSVFGADFPVSGNLYIDTTAATIGTKSLIYHWDNFEPEYGEGFNVVNKKVVYLEGGLNLYDCTYTGIGKCDCVLSNELGEAKVEGDIPFVDDLGAAFYVDDTPYLESSTETILLDESEGVGDIRPFVARQALNMNSSRMRIKKSSFPHNFLDYNKAWTMTFWLKVNVTDVQNSFFFTNVKSNLNNNPGIRLWFLNGGISVLLQNNYPSNCIEKRFSGVVYEGTGRSLSFVSNYVFVSILYDGSSTAAGLTAKYNLLTPSSNSVSYNTLSASLLWDGVDSTSNFYQPNDFNASIRDIRMFSKKLSDSELEDIYKNKIVLSGIEGWWPMEGEKDTITNIYKPAAKIAQYGQQFGNGGYSVSGATFTTINYPVLGNLIGYTKLTDSTYVLPNISNQTLDARGNLLQYFGRVPAHARIEKANCVTVGTTDTLWANWDIVNGETMTNGGTAIPVLDVTNNRITFSGAGTIFNLVIGGIRQFPCAEGFGDTLWSNVKFSSSYLRKKSTALWSKQNAYFYNLRNDHWKLTSATGDTIIRVPGLRIKPVKPGFTTKKVVAGNYWNDNEASIDFRYSVPSIGDYYDKTYPFAALGITLDSVYTYRDTTVSAGESTAFYHKSDFGEGEHHFLFYLRDQTWVNRGQICSYLKNSTDVALYAGQSNAAGSETGAPTGVPTTLRNAWMFQNFSNANNYVKTQYLISGSQVGTNYGSIIGPEYQSGNLYYKQYGKQLYQIKYAVGATSLNTAQGFPYWNPVSNASFENANHLYPKFVQYIAKGLDVLKASGRRPRVTFFSWAQGENDAAAGGAISAAYQANQNEFFDKLRKDSGLLGLKIVDALVPSTRYTGSATVNTAKTNISLLDKNVVTIGVDDLTLQGGTTQHYDAASQLVLGARILNAIKAKKWLK